jgi:ubiquinone/menaquinone biosynthesis C-methylase UbiE
MTDYLDFKADLANPEVAEAYDDFTYWSSMFGQLLLRHLRLAPRLTVLDVGCGTGFPLLELADRLGPTCTIHGIDSWTHAVARARLKVRVRGNTNVHVADGDAADMPYDDSSFDLIVSNLGVNNFDAPKVVMGECSRVCKPKGRIALTTNLVGHMSEFYQLYEQTLIYTGHSHLVEHLHQHQAHRATPEGLHELFSGAGLEVTAFHADTFTLRYADGSAFLRAYLTRLGFLDGWRNVLHGTGHETAVFEELEERLNRISRINDGLCLSIPAAYIEGRKKE